MVKAGHSKGVVCIGGPLGCRVTRGSNLELFYPANWECQQMTSQRWKGNRLVRPAKVFWGHKVCVWPDQIQPTFPADQPLEPLGLRAAPEKNPEVKRRALQQMKSPQGTKGQD